MNEDKVRILNSGSAKIPELARSIPMSDAFIGLVGSSFSATFKSTQRRLKRGLRVPIARDCYVHLPRVVLTTSTTAWQALMLEMI